jgi:hypothetical protein
MTTEALKSTAITNADATPPVRSTAGAGGQGNLQSVLGVVTPSNGVTTGSTYRMVRLPSNCYVKHIYWQYSGTLTTWDFDCTIYYSDLGLDETGASEGDTGVVNSLSGSSALFAHAVDADGATAGVIADITNQNNAYLPAQQNEPLWQAAGLASDPGGFFDVTLVMTDTASVTTATVAVEAQFIMPYSG